MMKWHCHEPIDVAKGLLRRMVVTKRTAIVVGSVLFLFAVCANNSSLLTKPIAVRPTLLAHRGVHQNFLPMGVTNDTCTASRIFPSHHNFMENTIPSMKEAIKYGADVIEFDVQFISDGNWVVFHDWTLDCRTDGHGVTRHQTLAYLKSLDIGYGYTADGGKTFPLRGKGVGAMPSLDEVLDAFPNRSFLIHIKSDDPREGAALAQKLKTLPKARLRGLMVYGGHQPIGVIRREMPDLRTMSIKTEKSCLRRPRLVGLRPKRLPQQHPCSACQHYSLALGLAKQVSSSHAQRRDRCLRSG